MLIFFPFCVLKAGKEKNENLLFYGHLQCGTNVVPHCVFYLIFFSFCLHKNFYVQMIRLALCFKYAQTVSCCHEI
jgi:hypothetical protein